MIHPPPVKQAEKRLRAGKLDIDILKDLLEKHAILDPQVVLGPKIGEDAAVVDPGKDRITTGW